MYEWEVIMCMCGIEMMIVCNIERRWVFFNVDKSSSTLCLRPQSTSIDQSPFSILQSINLLLLLCNNCCLLSVDALKHRGSFVDIVYATAGIILHKYINQLRLHFDRDSS